MRSQRQAELLEMLVGMVGWMRPMDIGGRDGSHHTQTLRALVDKGLVERRLRGTLRNMIGGGRGSYRYRITRAGRKALGR